MPFLHFFYIKTHPDLLLLCLLNHCNVGTSTLCQMLFCQPLFAHFFPDYFKCSLIITTPPKYFTVGIHPYAGCQPFRYELHQYNQMSLHSSPSNKYSKNLASLFKLSFANSNLDCRCPFLIYLLPFLTDVGFTLSCMCLVNNFIRDSL